MKLLQVNDLKVQFPIKEKGLFNRKTVYLNAVDGVSINLNKGETLGIVGESGCGKTTTGLAILRLVEPTQGTVFFLGQDMAKMSSSQLKAARSEMQIIFQDPFSSLNPRMSINQMLRDPMKIHGLYNRSEREERIAFLLEKVGLTPEQGKRYPHELSGGQRQRVGIARALTLNPQVIIGDEPVSALDVSIQAQIINLLIDLQEEFQLSYIIISHDLAVVEHICDRIFVMYLGRVVESAPYSDLYANPKHPYSQALLSAVPKVTPKANRKRICLQGDVPSPLNPPRGCHFHPRCPDKLKICYQASPVMKKIGQDHYVACHLF